MLKEYVGGMNMAEDSTELDEHPIYLNDLLHLDMNCDECKIGKVYFNGGWKNEKKENVRAIDCYINGEIDCPFSLHPYDDSGTARFKANSLLIIAIQLKPNNRWLLARIVRVKYVNPDKDYYIGTDNIAEVEDAKEYAKYFGRVIFTYTKKKGAQSSTFKIKSVLGECVVTEILPKPYKGEPFPGTDQIVNKKFGNLLDKLHSGHYGTDWYANMKVKGVYCLYNKDQKKFYIGIAYSEDGLAQRLSNYLDTSHGGNEELIKLYNNKKTELGSDEAADKYFKENFYYSILETRPDSATIEELRDREKHWKAIFNSTDLDVGYNANV